MQDQSRRASSAARQLPACARPAPTLQLSIALPAAFGHRRRLIPAVTLAGQEPGFDATGERMPAADPSVVRVGCGRFRCTAPGDLMLRRALTAEARQFLALHHRSRAIGGYGSRWDQLAPAGTAPPTSTSARSVQIEKELLPQPMARASRRDGVLGLRKICVGAATGRRQRRSVGNTKSVWTV